MISIVLMLGEKGKCCKYYKVKVLSVYSCVGSIVEFL